MWEHIISEGIRITNTLAHTTKSLYYAPSLVFRLPPLRDIMTDLKPELQLSRECLLDIIKVQTEIVQMGLDLGGVMAVVAQHAQRLTNAAGAVVELAEGEEMVYRAATGTAASELGLRLKRQGSLSGLCVAEGQPLRCDDAETDERVDREACRRVGLRSMIVVPLKHAEVVVVGVLKVFAPNPHAFSAADIQILEIMSDLIAAAMFHAVRYEANELFYQATHDTLTGLANRALFFDRLRQRLAHARRHSDRFGVLMLDLDGLKQINDRLGHRAGDATLREFAARIQKALRQADTVARLGGDEFAILLFHVRDADEAALASQRFDQLIRQPFQFEMHTPNLAASIGTAIFPEDGTEIEVILEKADQAMYGVKREHKRSKQ